MSPIYSEDEIIAWVINSGEVVCIDCLYIEEEIANAYTQDDIEREALTIICDRCGEKC